MRSLADLMPSMLAALGVPGWDDRLGLGPASASRACLLLVDGLGDVMLREHAALAPWLAAHRVDPSLTAGFPSTTAASISSIGTGLPPGEHGLVGYTIAVEGHDRAMNVLLWHLYGHGPEVDLRETLPPARFQPHLTTFEAAAAAGVAVTLVGPRQHAHSGLTRAALRGGRYVGAMGMGDLAAMAVEHLGAAERSLVYAYHAELDLVGHVRGPRSEAWRLQLALVDRLAESIGDRLPAGAVLVVTGDHGMLETPTDARVDIDDVPALATGVRLLAGEPRARHVHTEAGAAGDVLAAWRDTLAARMWVASRDEAVEGGWFGPHVSDRVLARIGDVVAASSGATVVTQRAVDPLQARLRGHHGSMLAGEQLVPLVVARG